MHLLTELYLQRSGDAPLDIFLNVSEAESLLSRLWPHAHRWRSAHLVPFNNALLDVNRTNILDLPILESLSLSSAEFTAVPECSPIPISNAPILRTLSLDMMRYTFDQLVLPWHQIHHLTMENLDVNQMHQALRLCSNAVTATFLRCANDFSYRDPVEYTSGDLSKLSIGADRRCETLGPDITHCFYPALTTFTLISGSQEFSFSHGIIPNLTSLIIRSNSHISSLTLHGISYNSKQLIELLQAVSPSLTKLDLCDVEHRAWNFLQMETWLIKAMIWSDVPALVGPISAISESGTYTLPGHLLPHLREFGIRLPGIRREIPLDREKIGVLLRMIESRCSSSIPLMGPSSTSTSQSVQSNLTGVGKVLERLHLGRLWSARMPLDFEERLRMLQSAGLEITAL